MPDNLYKHPFDDPKQILKSLEAFKNLDWDGKTLNDISTAYIKKFGTIPTYPIVIKKGTVVFRARKNDNKDVILFKELSDIGIIPKQYVNSFGRANIPNHSVFYCSTNEETVVREVTQWYVNDSGRAQDLFTKGVFGMGWSPFTALMTISAWVVKEDLTLALLFGNEQNRSLKIQDCEKDRYILKDGETADFNKSKNLVLDFFSNEFGKLEAKNQFDYIVSALYAFNVLYNQPHVENHSMKFDGVMYSSVANNFRGENYAISENSFKKKIQFLGANYCYTANNTNRMMDTDSTVIIGRDRCGLLKSGSDDFLWGDCTDEFDYIAHFNGQYLLFNLESTPSRFSKAVKRIS